MKYWFLLFAAAAGAFLLAQTADPEPSVNERLARHRNLGKAFYENPTTQKEAVEEFRKALALAPQSTTEQLNLALALLRAGETADAIKRLEQVQAKDPKLPHTWFNLGIHYKKLGENEKATAQFEQMIKLVPDDPISRYNLAALYKALGRTDQAVQEFQTAAKLDPNLAAPHFQLYNIYRTTGKMDIAKPELQIFQTLKKQQEGAAIPEDVEWNMYAEVYEVMADAQLPTPSGKPVFETGPAAPAAHALSADLDNDGSLDAVDLSADKAILLNNVKGALRPAPTPLASGTFQLALGTDYDHDYDIDLLLLGDKPLLLRNQGPAGFQDRSSDLNLPASAAEGVTAFRLIADTKGWDILISYKDKPAVLYRDRLQAKYEPVVTTIPPGARNLTPADLDNDGWIDVAFTGTAGVSVVWNQAGTFTQPVTVVPGAKTLQLLDIEHRGILDVVTPGQVTYNQGSRKFGDPVSVASLSACQELSAFPGTAGERPGVVCADANRRTVLLNKTATTNNWIAVGLAGVKNLKLAEGAEIEVKAGSRYQKRIYTGTPIHVGIGKERAAETVRITWPNGLIQNETRQPAGKLHSYQEAQRLSGSCPMIWTWNGAGFEYITDVLGVAPLGASAGDGQYFPVDHDEYIQIPGRSLRAVDGEYEIRITEELSEVAYLDQIKLFAVDHPADTALFTNDKFKGPPFPEFRLFGVRSRRYPAAAYDFKGRPVLSRLTRKDRAYPDEFPRDLAGVGRIHHLDLDFGASAAPSNKSVIVMSGWVDWADGSTFLGVAQHGTGGLVPPYLQVKDAGGRWVTVIEDMGMPAGKPKTIVVDLTGKFLSASREVRIVTNLCVYWDEIFMSEDVGAPVVEMREAPAQLADLRFRGFSPVTVHPERKQPEFFSYPDPKPVSMWNPTPGMYTRYGDVRPLARDIDDKMIVMGSGDEIRLRFKDPGPVKPGYVRDFLLLVDGWAKDRDMNTAFSQSTEPLPFHKMSRFPYPATESYPDDAEHREYRATYNTRPALRLLNPLARR